MLCWNWQPKRGEDAAAPCPRVQPVARLKMYSQHLHAHTAYVCINPFLWVLNLGSPPAIVPLCSSGLMQVCLWWADGPSDGPMAPVMGLGVAGQVSSCHHLSVLLFGCADEVLPCNLTIPNLILNVVQRASSSRSERVLSLVSAHRRSMLTEWQDCAEIKPLIGQRRAGESSDQNIIWRMWFKKEKLFRTRIWETSNLTIFSPQAGKKKNKQEECRMEISGWRQVSLS